MTGAPAHASGQAVAARRDPADATTCPPPDPALSVILPAHDEAAHIGDCLAALLASDPGPGTRPGDAEIVVVANGCRDATARIARSYGAAAAARGWSLRVLERAESNKLAALNAGDRAARGGLRVYLDADVYVDPPLLAQLARALDVERPAYASGRPRIPPAASGVTRRYARFWSELPFMTGGVPGFGVFAVNAAGRARWQDFPDIISDDTFVRLHFAPCERIGVDAGYSWPMVEGFARLVRVRRRQDNGVTEIARLLPALLVNDDKPPSRLVPVMRRSVRDPVGFLVYATVSLAVRLAPGRAGAHWARGR